MDELLDVLIESGGEHTDRESVQRQLVYLIVSFVWKTVIR